MATIIPNSEDNNCDWQRFAVEVSPVVDYSMRALCVRPYPGHRHGCPKFNKGYPMCPPEAPYFDKVFDLSLPIYAIINEFDMKSHVEKLAERNPKWTDRQLRCCLYWQATARKQLDDKIKMILRGEQFKDYISTTCPEAMGVNITETMRKLGLDLEWPPVNVTRQIALIGKINIEHDAI